MPVVSRWYIFWPRADPTSFHHMTPSLIYIFILLSWPLQTFICNVRMTSHLLIIAVKKIHPGFYCYYSADQGYSALSPWGFHWGLCDTKPTVSGISASRLAWDFFISVFQTLGSSHRRYAFLFLIDHYYKKLGLNQSVQLPPSPMASVLISYVFVMIMTISFHSYWLLNSQDTVLQFC